jgi:pimeloyl-ACP methyl ester carboxylesterase
VAVLGLVISPISRAEPGFKGATRERVEFANGNCKLAGELLLPRRKGPHPVVVFVHGSGRTPRDCGGYYVPIWDRLLRHGYACLSWDKPGVGQSTGDWKTQSIADRVSEVKAALGLLKKRRDIDPKRIGVWGISQAGYVVPELAARGQDISFAILVSPAHANMLNVSRYQLADDFVLRFVIGVAKDDVKEAASFVREMFKMAERRAPYKETVAFLKAAERKPWFKVLARAGCPTSETLTPRLYEKLLQDATLDPRPSLEKMTCPMLVVFGSEDKQIDPVGGAKTYQEAATKAKNKDFTLVTIRGADHNLMVGESGQRRMSPEGLDLMERWVAKHSQGGDQR